MSLLKAERERRELIAKQKAKEARIAAEKKKQAEELKALAARLKAEAEDAKRRSEEARFEGEDASDKLAKDEEEEAAIKAEMEET